MAKKYRIGRNAMDAKHCEVLIVGAGISGLTAATYAAKNNHSVIVLEKNSICGGLLNSFARDGYVFDTGARSIENSGIIKPMLKELGIEMELLSSPVSIGIEKSVVDFYSRKGIEEYMHLLESLYPEQKKDIQEIHHVINKVFKEMQVLYGFDNPVFKNYRTDRKYLIKELLPWFGRFVIAVARMQRMNEPVATYLSRFTDNQSLIDIIAQHFFKQTPSFFALGYFYVYLDYLYPRGGTGKLAQKLTQNILEQGGEIVNDSQVTSIHPTLKMVKDSQGQVYTYDTLVWGADLRTLYNLLDTVGLESKQIERIETQRDKILAGHSGDSVFTLYLGVDKSPQYFASISKGHLFYTPCKQGLGQTHLLELHTILEDNGSSQKTNIFSWVEKYSRLTTYEISIPSLRDSQLSPEGKTGLVISFLLDYEMVRVVSDHGWYDEFKLHVEACMIQALQDSLFPGLADGIELRFSSTPLSIENVYGNYGGGITGWTFEQAPPVINKLPKIPRSVITPIPNVLQCGQWVYSPAGIPTAILTGWYAADAIGK